MDYSKPQVINKMCKLGTDSQHSLKFTFKLLLKQPTFVDEQINMVKYNFKMDTGILKEIFS